MKTLTKHVMLTKRDKALKALSKRRTQNAKLTLPDNDSLPAGSPMYFHCKGCRAKLTVPEDYVTRPGYCDDCQELVDKGWLE